jgi:hypothetical protein
MIDAANRTIIKVPVNGNGKAGTPVLFTTGINAPDGIAIDADDNIGIARIPAVARRADRGAGALPRGTGGSRCRVPTGGVARLRRWAHRQGK